MASEKGEVTETGTVASSNTMKPSFMSRVAAHFKKWWWAYLIAFIIVVLVVALPVVYVGYPNIAQGNIDDSALEVKSMVISDPTPNSFHVNQTQIVKTKSIFHPTIYSFNASVGLLGAAAPFATVTIPQLKSRDGEEVLVDQRLDLTDVSAFGDFATAAIQNEYLYVNVYGKPELRQRGLPKITVAYNKTATMKGLNKLQGFNLFGIHLSNQTADGTNIEGQALIPNPSVMTISMGNVTLDLSVNGSSIGTAYIKGLVLKPGNNTLPMTAQVDLLAMLNFMGKYPGTVVPVDITGSQTNSSVYDGQALSYFSRALASNKLRIALNVSQVVDSSSSSLPTLA
ncbi:hypothetical protein BDV28DRAFT_115330 [Aspergillus coremiiformis]|uniref:Uncharacterized protein n=1 Tax=Aspergillus coremiiformis TaxID=138285 RepID=A0A5N6Z6G7_9EURO|nr:hypothetical protein BDV28DRAFT_115330 [Aspergillus coremiiformis]